MAADEPTPPPPSPATGEKAETREGEVEEEKSSKDSCSKSTSAVIDMLREEQVQNAVKFLSNPKVRDSPVSCRHSFLEEKGLTREEINEAFHRVSDPPADIPYTQVDPANYGSVNSQEKRCYTNKSKTLSTEDMNETLALNSAAAASMTRESTATPYSRSFMEIMAMIQRGETPPGIKEVNDMPPNPFQPLGKPRIPPRLKPWETVQKGQQILEQHESDMRREMAATMERFSNEAASIPFQTSTRELVVVDEQVKAELVGGGDRAAATPHFSNDMMVASPALYAQEKQITEEETIPELGMTIHSSEPSA